MSQPQWKLIANLGDVSPIECGGYFVYVDEAGVYPPEAEYLFAPDSDNAPEGWELYRFILEPCTYQNGILSDNKFHPDHAVWFADKIADIAATMDEDPEDLIAQFCSNDPLDRANAWRCVGEHSGFNNLDSYPLTFKNRFRIERFARKYRKDWPR